MCKGFFRAAARLGHGTLVVAAGISSPLSLGLMSLHLFHLPDCFLSGSLFRHPSQPTPRLLIVPSPQMLPGFIGRVGPWKLARHWIASWMLSPLIC